MKLLDSPATLVALLALNAILVLVALAPSKTKEARADGADAAFTMVSGDIDGLQQDAIYIKSGSGKLTAIIYDSDTKKFKRVGRLHDLSEDMGKPDDAKGGGR